MSRNRPSGAVVVAAAGAGLALAVARVAGWESGIDGALPFWVLLASLAGAVAASAVAAQRVALVIPLYLAAAIAIPHDAARHFAYGLLLAAALAVALLDVLRDGEVPRGRAIALALLVVATRAFPLEPQALIPLLLLAGGAAALIVAASRSGTGDAPALPLPGFVLAVALALVTPLAPWNAALVPLVIALAFASTPAPSAPALTLRWAAAAAVALVAALVVGRWMAAGVAAIVAARVLSGFVPRARSAAPAVAFPLAASRAGGAIAAFGFAPAAVLAPALAWQRVAAALLFALSLLARPQPALILALAALLVLVRPQQDAAPAPWGGAGDAVPAVLLFCAVALTAWSGAVAASFPLFADRALWVPFALAAALALLLAGASPSVERGTAGEDDEARRPRRALLPLLASIAGAAAFVVFVGLLPDAEPSQRIRTAVAPGTSFAFELPKESRAFSLVVSGANVSGLAEGTRVGTLQVVDIAGRAFQRPIAIGDLADWGAFRSGDLFRTTNPLPHRPGWTIRGEGRNAVLYGEGRLRVALDTPIDRVIVVASPALSPDARLQVERVEVAP